MSDPRERLHMILTLEYFRLHAQGNEDGTYTIDASMMERTIAAIDGDTPSLLDLSASMLSMISPHSFADWRALLLVVMGSKTAVDYIKDLAHRR